MPPASTQPEASSPEPERYPRQQSESRFSVKAIGRSVPQLVALSDATSTARQMKRSSPQQPSSREMTPPEGFAPIKYTRTGRVSRANKGKRVHDCEECGKIYTRAEHLRRHQQNHKPGAFPCDIPGCNRSFYREDLLVRHKARHNDPLNPVTAFSSPSSEHSEPQAQINAQLQTYPINDKPGAFDADQDIVGPTTLQTFSPERSHHTVAPSSQKRDSRPNALVRDIPVIVNGVSEYESAGYYSDSSFQYSPSGFNSPSTAYYAAPHVPLQLGRTRQSSDASNLGLYPPLYASPSPMAHVPITMPPPYWSHMPQEPVLQTFEASYSSDELCYDSMGEHCEMIDLQTLPECRDLMESSELLVPWDGPGFSSLDIEDNANQTHEDRCLDSYWRWIHPLYPVIHKPSFSLENASPLLRAAMIALGAQASIDVSDKKYAKVVHERCLKILKKRTLNSSHSFRTCDLQAVLLVELYSIFKSRRPPSQFSRQFEDVYRLLASDSDALDSTSIKSHHFPNFTPFNDELPNNTFYSYDADCRRRLLIACYMLDQQHSLLFGRQRSDAFFGDGADLPFPESHTTCDGENGTLSNTAGTIPWPVQNMNSDVVKRFSHDMFQSMHQVGSFFDSRKNAAIDLCVDAERVTATPAILQRSPTIELAYHTSMLCDNTPIRDLLAVAGESWVMSEKMSSSSQYTAAQAASREWALGHTESSVGIWMHERQTQVYRAHSHALKILELHRANPKTGLLFQEWSIYLASLVIWARAYVVSTETLRKSAASANMPNTSSVALDTIVLAAVARGADRSIDLQQAMGVLCWAKQKIEAVDVPHTSGLTNGALDVLGRLITGGTKPGWFGS